MARKRQRITLEDVAREAGVSAMTVSRVINNTGRISQATREHVREVIARLDYRPSRIARSLVTNETHMIGLVVPDIASPYFAEIVQGAEEIAWEKGYSILLANTSENPQRELAILPQLEETKVDGLIWCSSRLPEETLLALLEKHTSAVIVNRQAPPHLASVVRSRYGLGYRARRAAAFLIQTGRRRIGYLQLHRSAAAAPIEDFIAELARWGVEINHKWYIPCAPLWQSGYEHAQELIVRHPELDAIIGGNDLVALGAMRAVLEAGRRVPDDIAIVGGDDIFLAGQVTPTLTTFHVPKHEIGVMAARLLFKRLEGDTTYHEHLFDERLIVRASAPLPPGVTLDL